MTLHTYFGIIKSILELIYYLQEASQQSKITPLISADITPIIESTLYMDYDKPNENRILNLNFPMMALFNIPGYSPYLFHEIFHYVVPKDRIIRNWAKGICIVTYIMQFLIKKIMFSLNYTDKVHENLIDNVINIIIAKYIYNIVLIKYTEETVSHFSEEKLQYSEISEKTDEWLAYEKKIIYGLKNCFEDKSPIITDNFIFTVIYDLYDYKENIMEDIRIWTDTNTTEINKDKALVYKMTEKFFTFCGESIIENIERSKEIAFWELIDNLHLTFNDVINYTGVLSFSSALSEAICDIQMIELSKMNIMGYLLSYIKIQKDILKNADSDSQIQNEIRTGLCIDYILNNFVHQRCKNQEFNSYKDDFINSYIGLYYSQSSMNNAVKSEEDPNIYFLELKDEAEKWFDTIEHWYYSYLRKYSIFSGLFKEIIFQESILKRAENNTKAEKCIKRLQEIENKSYYDYLKVYGWDIRKSMQNEQLSNEERLDKISEAKASMNNKIFELNINIIQKFHKQEDFGRISEICENEFTRKNLYQFPQLKEKANSLLCSLGLSANIANKKVERDREPWHFMVTNIEQLFSYIKLVADSFEKQDKKEYFGKTHSLWYRGQQDYTFKLLPSAMRKFALHSKNSDDLRSYQRELFEEFKFRLDNATEKVEEGKYVVSDYLALMQHYGTPTIYMDWSENAISALYFALESYIDESKKEQQSNKPAVLYILNPNLYNKARNRIMDLAGIPETGRHLDRKMLNSRQRNTDRLPNLSVDYNAEKYSMFLLGEVEDESIIAKYSSIEIKDLYSSENLERLLYLPLAVYASRANRRVQAQYGMFMAYNIFTPPSRKNNFDYMALERIQELYLKKFKDSKPFLYSITIQNESKKKIAEWLKVIGVSKDIIYPELSNISERI